MLSIKERFLRLLKRKIFSLFIKRLDRELEIHFDLYQKKEEAKSEIKVGEEVCRVSTLTAVLNYVNEGYHYFDESTFTSNISQSLKDRQPIADTPEIKRRYGESIKERLTLDLQAFGLIRSTTRQRFDQPQRAHEFTEKMHRFKYWLDYSGYLSNDLYIECEPSLTLTEKVEGESQSPEQDRSIAHVLQVDREMAFSARVKKWRTTEEGVIAAKREVNKVFEVLQTLAQKSNEVAQLIKLDFNRVSEYQAILSSRGYSLRIAWICKHDNNLDGARLVVDLYKAESNPEGQSVRADSNTEQSAEYVIAVDHKFDFYWRENKQHEQNSSNELAEVLLKQLSSKLRRAYAD
ncbi:MAG: hypothetical protein QOG00_1406 [Pyrinomonadaceae bacterium]|nr:hypothetical protein [Pyrinomonadaceae bacterium]